LILDLLDLIGLLFFLGVGAFIIILLLRILGLSVFLFGTLDEIY
jgi:hypothetical protein